jgi:hypothetical protein
MRSRKDVNCENTTDFMLGERRVKCDINAGIFAEVCADGERG